MLFDMRDHRVQFFEAVGKTVRELYAGMLIISEEVGEAELVGSLILIVLPHGVGVDDPAAAPPPLGQLFDVAVAHLHALAVEAAALAESANNEVRLAPQPLHVEVEPR
jgi:hypothetical protein